MKKGFFITGTDTGVGKTVVAGVFARAVALLGYNTAVMKPIETGCLRKGSELIAADGLFLKRAAGSEAALSLISPVRLENPLAPLAAAEIERTEISIKKIIAAFHSLTSGSDAIVVEGLGGLMVPIRKDYYVSNLAAELGLPLVIVARPGLGTINHIMLTADHAERQGLEIAGLVLNYARPPENSIAEETNPGLLEKISGPPLLGIFPFLQEINEESIARIASAHLDPSLLKKYL